MGDADGHRVLTYDQAVRKASEWFDTKGELKDAAPTPGVQLSRELTFSPVGSEFTVGHAIRDFVEWKRLVSTKTHFSTMMSLINRHIVPNLASIRVADLSADAVRDFIRLLLETPPRYGYRPLGPRIALADLDDEALRRRRKTANAVLSYLRTSLRMAWEAEKIDGDRVWRRIGRFRGVDQPRSLHLSREECRRLLTVCRQDLRDLVLGALYTGCRVTELCNMKCSDIGRDGYGVYVPRSKTHRPRFVFLPDEGMAWFLSITKGRAPDERVFLTRRGHAWRTKTYSGLLREAVRTAGLPDGFSFHGLRHTYASQLVQAGASIFAISDQLGHSNPMTIFRTYGHLSPQVRESEVRQRFTVLDRGNARIASKQAKNLNRWRGKLHGRRDWRTYAQILDLASRSNREEGEKLASATSKQIGEYEPPLDSSSKR